MIGALSHAIGRTFSKRGFERMAACTQTFDDSLFVRVMRIDASVYIVTDGPAGSDRIDIPDALVARLGHLLFDAAWLAVQHAGDLEEAMLRTSLAHAGTRFWIRFTRKHGTGRIALLGSYEADAATTLLLYPVEAFALAFLLWREAGELGPFAPQPVAEAA